MGNPADKQTACGGAAEFAASRLACESPFTVGILPIPLRRIRHESPGMRYSTKAAHGAPLVLRVAAGLHEGGGNKHNGKSVRSYPTDFVSLTAGYGSAIARPVFYTAPLEVKILFCRVGRAAGIPVDDKAGGGHAGGCDRDR